MVTQNAVQVIFQIIIYFCRFSFVITNSGEIQRVYHPAEEDPEVVATKKGFAALFASRLHLHGEVIYIQENFDVLEL